MKNLLILAIVLLAISGSAQNYYYYGSYYQYDFYGNRINDSEKEDYVKNNVKNVKYYQTSDKTPRYMSYQQDINKDGLVEKTSSYNAKGKLTFGKELTYANDKIHIEKWYKKGKLTSWKEQNYNEEGKLLNSLSLNKKMDTVYYSIYTYVDDKMSEYNHYYKGKFRRKIVYTYYADGKTKAVEYYDKKLKLKKVTSYQCSDEGKTQLHKDTTAVCRIEEYTDSLRIVSHISTNEKGVSTKWVQKYNLDSALVESSSYDEKGQLSYRSTYQYTHDRNTKITTNYKKNGKIKRSYTAVTDKSERMLLYTYSRKKYFSETAYNYFENGLNKNAISTRKGKSNTTDYEYKYFE